MQNKSYTVIIHFDLNTVDCPGVWLCPKGKAFLKVCLFGCADISKDVNPYFPLTIRERFIFEKDFRNVSSIYELHDKIGRSVISIELLQCPVGNPGCVTLAIFNSLLTDLLHPYSTCFAKPPDTNGIELLFTTCKLFPGVIAPKADVSVKVVVSDLRGDGGKPTVRRIPLSLRKGDRKRQKPVCHTKNGLNCGCFNKNLRQSGGQDNIVTAERKNDDVEPRGLASSKPGVSRPGFQETTRVSESSQKREPHNQTDSTSAEGIDPMERYPSGDTDVTPIEPSDTEEPSVEMPRKSPFVYGRKPYSSRMMDKCEELLEGVDPKNVRIDPSLKMRYDSCMAQAVRERMHESGGLKSVAPQPRPVEIPCHGKCCKCKENAKKSQVEGVGNENEVETFEMRRDNNPGRLSTVEETESFPLKSYYRKERVRKRDYESTTRERFRRERQEESRERMRSGRTQRNTQNGRSQRRGDQSSRRGQEHERLRRQDSKPSESSEDNVDPKDIRVTQTRRESAGDQNDARSRPQSSSQRPNASTVKRPTVTKIPRKITKPYDRGENGNIHAVSTKKPVTEPQPRRPPSPKPPIRRPTEPEEGGSSGDCDCNLCEQYQELYNPSVHPCPRFRPNEPGRTNGINGSQKSPTRPGSKKLVQSRKYAQGPSTEPPRYDRERDREREECGLFTCDGSNDIQAVEEMNAIQKFYHGK